MLRETIVQRRRDRDQDMQTPDRLVGLSLSPARGKGISALHPVLVKRYQFHQQSPPELRLLLPWGLQAAVFPRAELHSL